jgi:hypothetical protein
MTKGQLLALDTPSNIKKQFGVGYKLLIEPRTEVMDSIQFMTMKKDEITPLLDQYRNYEIFENAESTPKKLIY